MKEAGCSPIFQDSGISGTAYPRLGLEKALKRLKSGDTLVVTRQDRLGRDPLMMETWLQRFIREGIDLEILNQPKDIRTASGKLMFRMQYTIDANELDTISERTAAGMKAHKTKGKKFGRKVKLTRDQALAAKVLFNVHKLSYDKIACQLSSKDFTVSGKTVQRAIDNLVEGECDN